MTCPSPIAELAMSCILDLSRSSEDLGTFVPAFFSRKSPDVCEDDQRRVLILSYELCWSRAEELQKGALHLTSLPEKAVDLDIAHRAVGLRKLSNDGYVRQ